jgi:hypothetical protein
MKPREILTLLAFAIGLVLAIWLLAGNNLLMYKVFGSAHEGARREIFEESKAYRDGTLQELMKLRVEYVKAPDNLKPAVASMICHQSAGYSGTYMPTDLRNFIQGLQCN